jgi:hypothetical protein
MYEDYLVQITLKKVVLRFRTNSKKNSILRGYGCFIAVILKYILHNYEGHPLELADQSENTATFTLC